MNRSPFICKSKSSGASTGNLEHLLAELKRIDLKLRLRVMQVSSTQSSLMLSVASSDGVDAYNKHMAAGK